MSKNSRFYSNGMGEKRDMEKMFHRITQMISNLLTELDYLYEVHNITYEVSSYHEILLKILLPIELKDKLECSLRNVRLNFNNKEFEVSTPKLNQSTEFNLENDQSSFPYNEKHNENEIQIHRSDEEVSNYGKNEKKVTNGCRLGLEAEEDICKWAYHQANNGKNVLRREIIELGRKWAHKKNIKFGGSNGWYNRFLSRNQGLKKLIMDQKYARNNRDHNEFYEAMANKWKLTNTKSPNFSSDCESEKDCEFTENKNEKKYEEDYEYGFEEKEGDLIKKMDIKDCSSDES